MAQDLKQYLLQQDNKTNSCTWHSVPLRMNIKHFQSQHWIGTGPGTSSGSPSMIMLTFLSSQFLSSSCNDYVSNLSPAPTA